MTHSCLMDHQRTIKLLRDNHIGQEITAEYLLNKREDAIFELRRALEENAIRLKKGEAPSSHLVCALCNQPLRLVGNRFGHFFFKHFKDSDDCPYKTDSELTKEQIDAIRYNGIQESDRHKHLKAYIKAVLEKDSRFAKVEEEKRISAKLDSKSWRQPDISCRYLGQDLAIEIQLSSTYQDVIVSRELFYQEEQRHILWIFDDFSKGGTLFTEKDIYFNNNKNAFVITAESEYRTEKSGELVLECYYQVPELINGRERNHWAKEWPPLSKLTFNNETYKLFYYNYDQKLRELQAREKQKDLKRQFERCFLLVHDEESDIRDVDGNYYYVAGEIGKSLNYNDRINGDSLTVEVEGTLKTLYSMKYKRMIGYRYQDCNIWIRLINNEMINRPQHTWLMGRAIKTFGIYDEISEQHRRSCKKRSKGIRDNMEHGEPEFQQNKELKEFFLFLFPELKEIQKPSNESDSPTC